MLTKAREKLSYANVVATLALFAALGGGAVAAVTLEKNSVGSRQIKAEAVRTAELGDDAVTLEKIARDAGTSRSSTGGPVSITTGASVQTAELSLPRGTFAVFAYVQLENLLPSPLGVACSFQRAVPVVASSGQAQVPASENGAYGRETIAMHAIARGTGPGVAVVCGNAPGYANQIPAGPNELVATNTVITAVPLKAAEAQGG